MKDAVKEFVKHLTSLDYSRSRYDRFHDLCEMWYCAFAKLTAPSEERAEALEARYMNIVNRYQDKSIIRDVYPELLRIAWQAVAEGGIDFLGNVAGELEILDAQHGQFFTPYEVSRLMAEMTFTGMEEIIDRDGYFSVSDPASGAGCLILAAADMVQRRGYRPDINMLVYAVDVSPLAFYMCYLQLTWRVIPAYVERANTLTLESFEGAYTPAVASFVTRHGHLNFTKPRREEPESPVEVPPVERQPEPEPALALIQLSLF